MLLLVEDSIEGIVRGYTPRTKLLGAENRCGVTCYMDALLFAMFARLDCFEAILYKSFDDAPRRKLSILLRLWVNMLRAGKLITTDIVCIVFPHTFYSFLLGETVLTRVTNRRSICKRRSLTVVGKTPQGSVSRMLQKHLLSSQRSWNFLY